jgi:ankyrin repeat protein
VHELLLLESGVVICATYPPEEEEEDSDEILDAPEEDDLDLSENETPEKARRSSIAKMMKGSSDSSDVGSNGTKTPASRRRSSSVGSTNGVLAMAGCEVKKGSSLAVPQAAGKYAPTDAKSDDNASKSDDDASNNGSKVGRSSEGSSDGGDGGMSDNAGSDTGSGIVTRSRRPSISVSSDGEEVERDMSVEEVVVSQIGSALCETGFIFGTRQECEIESTALTNCLVLLKGDFQELAKDFPDMLDQAQKNLTQKLRQQDSPMLQEIEKLQVKSQKQIASISDMFWAAQRGEVETVREAIEMNHADPSETDFEGRTALHIAATAGSLAVVDLLIEKKSTVRKLDVFGKSALDNALDKGHTAVVKALQKAGAVLKWDASKTAGALCDAAREGQLDKLQLLVACGLHVDSADYDKRTCIHLAASEGNQRVIEFLARHGASVNVKDRFSFCASNLAPPTELLTPAAPPPYPDGEARRCAMRCARSTRAAPRCCTRSARACPSPRATRRASSASSRARAALTCSRSCSSADVPSTPQTTTNARASTLRPPKATCASLSFWRLTAPT